MTQPSASVIIAARAAATHWGIPASVTLAQWALESGWGRHMPPGSNNPFGIKAIPGQACVTVPTHELYDGAMHVVNAAFAAFPTLEAAFDAHASLLATSGHYAPARRFLPNVEAFCAALTGVYATDPHYGAELIAVIHGSDLTKYDTAPVPA